MITVTLYTRKQCRLCDQAKEDLAALQSEYPHRLVELDIETDPDLLTAFALDIPVIDVGPYRLKAPFDRQRLQMTLGAASDRHQHLEKIGGEAYQERVRRGQEITSGDRISYWLSRHYMWLITFLLFLYVGLPVLAPVLAKAGASGPANVIFTIYKPFCHQLAFRSFFLFGGQYAYPREAANIEGLQTFGAVTGFDENDLAAARQFIGNETMGYKMALCARDIAIYAAMLLFALVFIATRQRIKGLHWMLWALLGLGPIGLDGFSQLFSQINLPYLAEILPYRESTPLLRTLTGLLFGWTTAWFAFPAFEETMQDTRQFLAKKFAVTGKQ